MGGLRLGPYAAGVGAATVAPPRRGAATPETDVLVEEAAVEETRLQHPWRVVLYDDDVHTFDDVIFQLVKATGCSEARAERHAWTVHTRGKDVVFEGDFFDCLRVQGVLREIELVTEIEG